MQNENLADNLEGNLEDFEEGLEELEDDLEDLKRHRSSLRIICARDVDVVELAALS